MQSYLELLGNCPPFTGADEASVVEARQQLVEHHPHKDSCSRLGEIRVGQEATNMLVFTIGFVTYCTECGAHQAHAMREGFDPVIEVMSTVTYY